MELDLQLGKAAPIALLREPLPLGSSFGKSLLGTGIEGVFSTVTSLPVARSKTVMSVGSHFHVFSTLQRRVPEGPSGLIFSIWPRWAQGVLGSWIVETQELL